MNSSVNTYDAIEKFIYDENLKIETVNFYPESDTMLIILNTKAVLHQSISAYKRLQNAPVSALNNYELISSCTGIHWIELDEDLSLKGFLKDELKNVVKPNTAA